MQQCHQSSIVVKNASISLHRYTLNAMCVELTAVFAQFVTITKQHVPQHHKVSNIKSTHMGHHVGKGGILVELLKIRRAID